MSLINKMLQDLERRLARNDLDEMRVMPASDMAEVAHDRSRRRLTVMLLSMAVVLVIVLAGFWLRSYISGPTFYRSSSLVRDAIHLWKKAPDQSASGPAQIIRPSIAGAVSDSATAAGPAQPVATGSSTATLPQSAGIDDVSHAAVVASTAISAKNNEEPDAVAASPVSTPAPVAARSRSRKSTPVNTSANTPNDASAQRAADRDAAPTQAEANYRAAAQLIQADRMDEAIVRLQQAVLLEPRHAAARQTLIGLLIQQKNNAQATVLARDGLALDPSQTGMSMILARLQLDERVSAAGAGSATPGTSGLHSAIETLNRGLPYAAGRADYQAFLAALLQRDHQDKAAIAHYTLAVLAVPGNGLWWMGLGISCENDQQPAQAREAYARALNSDTLNPALRSFVNDKLARLN